MVIDLVDKTIQLCYVVSVLYLIWRLTLISIVRVFLLDFSVHKAQKRLWQVGQVQYDFTSKLININYFIRPNYLFLKIYWVTFLRRLRFELEPKWFWGLASKQMAIVKLVPPINQLIAALSLSVMVPLDLCQVSR